MRSNRRLRPEDDAGETIDAWGAHVLSCVECARFQDDEIATPCFVGLRLVLAVAQAIGRVFLAETTKAAKAAKDTQ